MHELENAVKDPGDIDATAETVLVSNYARLTRSQAIKKFWRLFAIGVAVASAGM